MDLEGIYSLKDDAQQLPKSKNTNERYSTLTGGQVNLKEVEPNQHLYLDHADKQSQLYRLYKADNTSTASQDKDHCHTKLIPHGQLDANLPSNVLPVTESFDTSPICCNILQRNDMNDDKLMCGACKLYFSSVCQLHSHLNNKHSPERYIFDFSIRTAFIEIDKVCKHTQTDFKELIELDKERFNVESDCLDDNRKQESNFDSIESDKLKECYSDGSDSTVTDLNYSADSQNKIKRNKLKQKESNRKRTGSRNDETSNNKVVVDIDSEAADVLGNHEDETCDSSSHHTLSYISDIPGAADSIELPSDKDVTLDDKVNSKTIVRNKVNKHKKSSAKNMKKKSTSFRNLLNTVPKNKHGRDAVVNGDGEGASGYQCEQCKTKYPSLSRLRHHMVKVHSKISDTTLRQCRWCRKTLHGVRSYLAHTRQCDKNENLICFICDTSFPTKSMVLEHLASHKNAQDYNCQFCQKSFSNELSLQHHLRRHNQPKNKQCEHCGKSFFYQYHLTRHLGYCNKDPHIKCDQCDLKFKTTKALDHHMTVHSNDRPYVCHICGYAVKRASYLTRHIRSHTGERPYSCSDCGVTFTTLTGLNRHKKIHTNHKPYVCTYCEKSFTNNWNLKTHLRQHTGDTPYKCELCGKSFKQNVLLKLHWKSHHP